MSKVGTISNKNQISSINKYYNIAKILLAISPCMSLMYLSMESAKLGISLAEVIGQDPNQTVMFLVSMINPFIAYLLIFIQKKIDNNDVKYAIVNLVMFMVAEILLMNLLYVILFGVILYKTLRAYNVTIKDSFKEKLGKGFFMTVSGSLVVIFLAGICLFATIRINM
ncbi:MAG: hypothetical protein PUJ51_22075 [Clostridiales bacterium]|uniref:hypothetical protein n=1 Tax=Terrisporobacter sp. TaxID=1965305 RepID=UPI002A503D2F|nr:hypothetical protein [Terrisporobacter sp.]MDD7757144.1 hypothetical protein [Clostridiales bacterium]MDY4135113.1 hypothetical protein [Terrisporobacter sp.]MDY4737013.1 hypothetical protein [Terrisporobacter sp.]